MSDVNVSYQTSRIDHTQRKFRSLGLPSLHGKRYLDLGCNAGTFCALALEEGAASVAGLDIDERMVQHAKQEIPEAEFFQSRFEDMDLGTREFDVITIASAIHYSREFLVVAKNIFDCLSPQGLLVIEGGLFDPLGSTTLNAPVPNWRQIGDHCRHLSSRFVSDVMFPDSNVTLVGPSLQQGGDNLSRYVLHVKRNGATASLERRPACIELEAFIRALAMSYDTIQSRYPISAYVEDIKRAALLGAGTFDSIMKNQQDLLQLIASEIEFCTSDWASEIVLRDCYNTEAAQEIVSNLEAKCFTASVSNAASLT